MKAVVSDSVYCAAAAVLGLWFDGPAASMSLQGFCAGAPVDLYSLVLLHLSITPITSLSMFAVALLCSAGKWSFFRMCGAAKVAVRLLCVLSSYLVMMALMIVGQHIAVYFENSPGGAMYGGLLGTVAFVVSSCVWRRAISAIRFSLRSSNSAALEEGSNAELLNV